MKLLRSALIIASITMFASCAHQGKSCSLACGKGECTKDKSCCKNKCHKCSGEKDGCKKNCDLKHPVA